MVLFLLYNNTIERQNGIQKMTICVYTEQSSMYVYVSASEVEEAMEFYRAVGFEVEVA